MAAVPNFSNDENGDVLRRMVDHGDDVSIARYIDFTVVLPDRGCVSNAAHFIELYGSVLRP